MMRFEIYIKGFFFFKRILKLNSFEDILLYQIKTQGTHVNNNLITT